MADNVPDHIRQVIQYHDDIIHRLEQQVLQQHQQIRIMQQNDGIINRLEQQVLQLEQQICIMQRQHQTELFYLREQIQNLRPPTHASSLLMSPPTTSQTSTLTPVLRAPTPLTPVLRAPTPVSPSVHMSTDEDRLMERFMMPTVHSLRELVTYNWIGTPLRGDESPEASTAGPSFLEMEEIRSKTWRTEFSAVKKGYERNKAVISEICDRIANNTIPATFEEKREWIVREMEAEMLSLGKDWVSYRMHICKLRAQARKAEKEA